MDEARPFLAAHSQRPRPMRHHLRALLAAWAAVVACAIYAAPAAAQTTMPWLLSQQPLTLPDHVMELDFDISYYGRGMRALGPEDQVFLLSTLRAAVTSNFEVGAALMPLQLGPDADYQNINFYVMQRFVRGAAEAALRLEIEPPVEDGSDLRAQFGVPILLRIGDGARLDLSLVLDLITTHDVTTFFSVPMAFSFQLNSPMYIGFNTGIFTHEFDDTRVPLGVFLGSTLGQAFRGPIADLRAHAGLVSVADGFHSGMVGATARFFLYL